MPKRTLHEGSHVQVTIIAEGTEFVGSLNSKSDIRINGSVDGDIKVEGKVIVSRSGNIAGQLTADTAIIAGAVKGEILIKQKLSLTETASVEGSIQTARLVVEEGASFHGDCVMKNRSHSHTTESGNGQSASEPTHHAAV